MPAPTAAGSAGWNRWVPGTAVLGFFFLSAGLWLGCLIAWDLRQPDLVVVLLGLGAFAPLVWLGVRLRTRPVWALIVPEDRGRTADSVRQALSGRLPRELAPDQAGHAGLFRGCDPVLRLEDPACLVGVRRFAGDSGTTLLLLPLSKDGEALDRLRASIAVRFRGAV